MKSTSTNSCVRLDLNIQESTAFIEALVAQFPQIKPVSGQGFINQFNSLCESFFIEVDDSKIEDGVIALTLRPSLELRDLVEKFTSGDFISPPVL